jgi:hypothetical protein
MKNIHPLYFIVLGILLCSIGFNICLYENNKKLIYTIQKLESGQARGLFLEPKIPKPPIDDKELKELMEQIFRKMKNERMV